jgi:hypothetical protein
MAVYEGVWDCTSCGAKAVRGSLRACSACGAPRADDVKFYLPKDAPAVTDQAQLAAAKAGEDWYCEHCGGGAKATQQDCPQCGAPRGSSKGHSAAKVEEAARRARAAGTAGVVAPAGAGSGKPAGKLVLGLCGLLFLFFLTCCCLAAIFGGPKDVNVQVVSKQWDRAQEVEVYKTVVEDGWDVPSGGRVQRQEKRQKDTRRVLDHTERRTRTVQVQTGTRRVKSGVRDLGNGHFEDTYSDEPVYGSKTESYTEDVYRDEPIYAQYFWWEIEKWVADPSRTAKASGSDDEPTWPTVQVSGNKERSGPRREHYRLVLSGPENKSYTHELDEGRWRGFTKGQTIVAAIQGDEVKEVKPLELEKR